MMFPAALAHQMVEMSGLSTNSIAMHQPVTKPSPEWILDISGLHTERVRMDNSSVKVVSTDLGRGTDRPSGRSGPGAQERLARLAWW